MHDARSSTLHVDLVELLQHAPRLLRACVLDDLVALQALRLVNKEASRVALRGLDTYTLTLKGGAQDTNVGGASLLQQTCLDCMRVDLLLSGSFSPAVLLKAFVQEAGAGLSTITRMFLYIEDTGGSAVTAAVLWEAAAVLVRACPVLTSLSFQNMPPLPTFLRPLSKACPLLSALSINTEGGASVNLQKLLRMQPSFLPNLLTLTLTGQEYSLPDMSENSSIRTLVLNNHALTCETEWRLLPKNLKLLRCLTATAGPPDAFAGVNLQLCSLHSLTLDSLEGISLCSLARIIRAAPGLQLLCMGPEIRRPVTIDILGGPSLAADLSLLQGKRDVSWIRHACYRFLLVDTGTRGDWSFQPSVASLPRMRGFTQCHFLMRRAQEIRPLLDMFPDAEHLGFVSLHGFGDIALQAVASCRKVKSLKLAVCKHVTPLGLLALCMRLPLLRHLSLVECPQLNKSATAMCFVLLKEHGSSLEVVKWS